MREAQPPETVVRIGDRCFALPRRDDLAGLVARIDEVTPRTLAVQTSIGFVEVCRIESCGLILSHWPESGDARRSAECNIRQDLAVDCLWSFANHRDEWERAVTWRSAAWVGDAEVLESTSDSLRDTVAYFKGESDSWDQQRLYWLARSAAHDLVRKSLMHSPAFGDPEASEEEVALAAYELELLYLKFLLAELLPSSKH